MINRGRYKKLRAMSPAVQFWEMRYIAWQNGAYQQDDVADVLVMIKHAMRLHREQDGREQTEPRTNAAERSPR